MQFSIRCLVNAAPRAPLRWNLRLKDLVCPCRPLVRSVAVRTSGEESGADTASGRHVRVGGITQDVAAPPYGLDVGSAAVGRLQFLSQLADENIYDLELWLVHAAIEMIEEHLLGERGTLAQPEQLQHLIFLAGEVHALTVHLHDLGVEVYLELAVWVPIGFSMLSLLTWAWTITKP
jgi:hypothetical protein